MGLAGAFKGVAGRLLPLQTALHEDLRLLLPLKTLLFVVGTFRVPDARRDLADRDLSFAVRKSRTSQTKKITEQKSGQPLGSGGDLRSSKHQLYGGSLRRPSCPSSSRSGTKRKDFPHRPHSTPASNQQQPTRNCFAEAWIQLGYVPPPIWLLALKLPFLGLATLARSFLGNPPSSTLC